MLASSSVFPDRHLPFLSDRHLPRKRKNQSIKMKANDTYKSPGSLAALGLEKWMEIPRRDPSLRSGLLLGMTPMELTPSIPTTDRKCKMTFDYLHFYAGMLFWK